jgi:hypothetical protein
MALDGVRMWWLEDEELKKPRNCLHFEIVEKGDKSASGQHIKAFLKSDRSNMKVCANGSVSLLASPLDCLGQPS